jgi:hypothetical protein
MPDGSFRVARKPVREPTSIVAKGEGKYIIEIRAAIPISGKCEEEVQVERGQGAEQVTWLTPVNQERILGSRIRIFAPPPPKEVGHPKEPGHPAYAARPPSWRGGF